MKEKREGHNLKKMHLMFDACVFFLRLDCHIAKNVIEKICARCARLRTALNKTRTCV
jgi:hypothetical protein